VGLSRDFPNFRSIPIISGIGKATNFKFGRCIQSVHSNKSPLIIWEKRERGRIQGLSNFFEYSILSQKRVKLRTSNLAGRYIQISEGPCEHKPMKNFREKGAWHIQGLPNFFEYPLLSLLLMLLGNFKFGRYSKRPCKQKPLNYLGEEEAWAYPGLPKFLLISEMGKATNFQLCTDVLSIDRNKRPLQISGKVAVGQDSRNFPGHPYAFCALRGRLCDSSGFLSSYLLI